MAAFATLSLLQGETERAITLLGVANALLEFIHTLFLAFDQKQYEENVRRLRDQIDERTFMEAWTSGHEMTFEQAVEFALKEFK